PGSGALRTSCRCRTRGYLRHGHDRGDLTIRIPRPDATEHAATSSNLSRSTASARDRAFSRAYRGRERVDDALQTIADVPSVPKRIPFSAACTGMSNRRRERGFTNHAPVDTDIAWRCV
ncbi:hypothetical protein, partial [Burkholderia multivorans]|uniref:hypothetical protein n=1 Tax=Burkholderia multivorans TaxID=87883 RepID=UPI0021BF8F5A